MHSPLRSLNCGRQHAYARLKLTPAIPLPLGHTCGWVGRRISSVFRHVCVVWIALLLLVLSGLRVHGQFTFSATNGFATLLAYTGPGGDVVIPATVEGLPVTIIAQAAFYNTPVTQVAIPDTVTYIWPGAFAGCTRLTNLTVDPSNPGYRSVAGILFNKTQTELWVYPAGRAGTYTVPNGVQVISGFAFAGCTNLAGVTIPDTVTYVALNAFQFCPQLTRVTLPNSVRELGDFAFHSCTGLVDVTLSTNLTSLGKGAFAYCHQLASVIVPRSVTNIGIQAFFECRSLTNATLDEGLIAIQDDAFDLCTSLTHINIPASVRKLAHAFKGCTGLTNIAVASANPVYRSVDGVLFSQVQASLSVCPGGKTGTYQVPDGTRTIATQAFNSSRLSEINVPNSVTNLADYAFFQCSALTNVTIGTGLSVIGYEAFEHCPVLTAIEVDPLNPVLSSLEGVLFNKARTVLLRCPGGKLGSYAVPEGVTHINRFAFKYCARLTHVTIPASVALIDMAAFENCASLTAVYCTGNPPSLVGSTVFWADPKATVFYLAGSTGWETTFGGRPTQLWRPLFEPGDGACGVRSNRFGFNLYGPANLSVVVETCTDLTNPTWQSVSTNTLIGGSSYFSDPGWAEYPARYYRLGFSR